MNQDPVCGGNVSPSGTLNSKFCMRCVKNRNNSPLANCSARQLLRPISTLKFKVECRSQQAYDHMKKSYFSLFDTPSKKILSSSIIFSLTERFATIF